MRSHAPGFTIVETTISLVLLVALVSALAFTVGTSRKASKATHESTGETRSARRIHRLISEELRSASRIAEDTNQNGRLEVGEDTNGNGRLDSDWLTAPTSIRFNRRLRDGTWSNPITYELRGDHIDRIETRADGSSRRTVVARSVSSFTVREVGARLELAFALRTGGAAQTISILLRN